MLSFAGNRCLAERHRVVAVGYLALIAAAADRLEEERGIVTANSRFQQALCVCRRCRHDDIHSAEIHERRITAVRVLGRVRAPPTVRGNDGDRHHGLPPRHEAQFRHLVRDGVEPGIDEVGKHHVQDDPVPGGSGSNGHPGQRRLADRCIADPIAAKLLQQPPGITHDGQLDVFAEQDDFRIAGHLLVECLVDRLDVSFTCHVVVTFRLCVRRTSGRKAARDRHRANLPRTSPPVPPGPRPVRRWTADPVRLPAPPRARSP